MAETDMFDLDDVELSCTTFGEGPLVLCAHGFPDDERSFREQVAPLVAQGFRVAVPTMRGYFPSGVAKSRRYDAEMLGRDLVGLADRLSPDEPVRLIGHDWGAIASYAATALAPERFSHLVTIAVPHMRASLARLMRPAQIRRSWYIWMFQLKGFAEGKLAECDLALIDELWRDWSPSYIASPDDLAHIKRAIIRRIPEVIAYYRAFFSPNSLFGEARRLLLEKTRTPSLYIHGVEDGCIGVDLSEGVEKHYLGGVTVRRVEGAGHFVHLEKPDVVNPMLLDFLGSP